jgi:hypothetical protein
MEDSLLLPVLVPIVVVSLVAMAALLYKKQKSNRVIRDEFYSEFLPPMFGHNLPKEQTYIVPRNWKPSAHGNGVYSPLSIPLQDIKGSRTSVIHALPPSKDSLIRNQPEFV